VWRPRAVVGSGGEERTKRRAATKNWDMPLFVPCARYSLVKGERIVRFVLSTRLVRRPRAVVGSGGEERTKRCAATKSCGGVVEERSKRSFVQ